MHTSLKYTFGLMAVLLFVSCSSKNSAQHKSNQHKKENKAQQLNDKTQKTLLTKPQAKNRQPKNHHPGIAKYVENASFTSLNGKKVSVADFRGKVVLIDFWETWCQPCVDSMPTLNKLQKKFPKRLKVLEVTPGFVDTKKDIQVFAKKHNYNFTYLMDTNDLHKKLHVTAIPYKVFLGPNGKFIKIVRGSRGPKIDYRDIKQIVEKYSKQTKKPAANS